jgi:integrase
MIEERKGKKSKSYRATVYGSDGRRVGKTFRSITLAKEWERRILRERDEQVANGIIVDNRITVKDYSDRWLSEKVDVRLSTATQHNYRRALRKHILPIVGQLLLKDVRMDHANRLVAILKANGHVPKGINMIVGVMLAMINDSVEWQVIAKNPLASYRPVKEPDLHFDYWSAAEVRQFLSATVNDPYQPFYIAAVNTGMRRGELCGLKWDRVDLATNQIVVTRSLTRYGLSETTKSGRRRFVPINPVMKELLRKLMLARKGEFVFTEVDGSPMETHHMYREFHAAQRKAGFKRLIRIHDLRHTFASHFMMNGGNIYDLQKILGHTSLEMTQRYAHMSPEHLAQAIKVVSFEPEQLGENVISLESEKKKLG